jgi:hypothetical protein
MIGCSISAIFSSASSVKASTSCSRKCNSRSTALRTRVPLGGIAAVLQPSCDTPVSVTLATIPVRHPSSSHVAQFIRSFGTSPAKQVHRDIDTDIFRSAGW